MTIAKLDMVLRRAWKQWLEMQLAEAEAIKQWVKYCLAVADDPMAFDMDLEIRLATKMDAAKKKASAAKSYYAAMQIEAAIEWDKLPK